MKGLEDRFVESNKWQKVGVSINPETKFISSFDNSILVIEDAMPSSSETSKKDQPYSLLKIRVADLKSFNDLDSIDDGPISSNILAQKEREIENFQKCLPERYKYVYSATISNQTQRLDKDNSYYMWSKFSG